MLEEGYELITMSITNFAKAILVFKKTNLIRSRLWKILIALGNLLYLAYIFFCGNETSDFGNFSSGLLLGLSIGCNFIGIILTVAYITKSNKSKN